MKKLRKGAKKRAKENLLPRPMLLIISAALLVALVAYYIQPDLYIKADKIFRNVSIELENLIGDISKAVISPAAPEVEEIEEKAEVEEEIKAINVSVIRRGRGKALFDQSHENGFLVIGENATYSHFASIFSEAGFKFEIAKNESELEEALGGSKLLIIAKPSKSYGEMKDDILKFVKEGGILILIGDADKKVNSNLNEISMDFGVIFNQDYIYDLYNYSLIYSYPIITDFKDHNITAQVRSIALYEASSLDLFAASEALAYAGKNAKSSLGFQELPVLSVSHYGVGYVISISDGDLWSNEKVGELDNELLLINAVNWLTR